MRTVPSESTKKVVNLESEEDLLKKTRGDIGVAHNNVGASQSSHLTVERGMVGLARVTRSKSIPELQKLLASHVEDVACFFHF